MAQRAGGVVFSLPRSTFPLKFMFFEIMFVFVLGFCLFSTEAKKLYIFLPGSEFQPSLGLHVPR